MAVQERAAMRLRGRGEPPRGPRDDLDLENEALLAAAAAAAAAAAGAAAGDGAAPGAAAAPCAPAAREADGLAADMDTEEDDAPEPAAPAPEAAQRRDSVVDAGARTDGDAGAAASAPALHRGQLDGARGAAPGLDGDADAAGTRGASVAPGPAACDPSALPGDDSDAETDSDGAAGGGGDPDVMPPPARRRRARAGAQDDPPATAFAAWVPVSERPAFPPAALGLRPAFARAGAGALADPAAAGELLAAWAFLGAFAGLLGLWPATLEELGDALAAGQASRLLGEAHVALLRLLLADMEEAHAGGALQVGQGLGLGPHPSISASKHNKVKDLSSHAAAPASFRRGGARAPAARCSCRQPGLKVQDWRLCSEALLRLLVAFFAGDNTRRCAAGALDLSPHECGLHVQVQALRRVRGVWPLAGMPEQSAPLTLTVRRCAGRGRRRRGPGPRGQRGRAHAGGGLGLGL